MIARARIEHADGLRKVAYVIIQCDERPDLKGIRFCPHEEYVPMWRMGDTITVSFEPDDQFAKEVDRG